MIASPATPVTCAVARMTATPSSCAGEHEASTVAPTDGRVVALAPFRATQARNREVATSPSSANTAADGIRRAPLRLATQSGGDTERIGTANGRTARSVVLSLLVALAGVGLPVPALATLAGTGLLFGLIMVVWAAGFISLFLWEAGFA